MHKHAVNVFTVSTWWLVTLFLLGLSEQGLGQVIYSNTFTGTGACPTQGNVPALSTNATGTPLTRSTITCETTSNVFNSKGLNNTASVNDASYIEFSVTANANAQLTVTSLSFFRGASNTAPNQLEVRYSTNNFVTSTSWGAAPLTSTAGSSVTWNFSDFSVPGGTTLTFRFYPYGTQRADLASGTANGSLGTFRLDDVTLNGSSPLPVNLLSFTAKPSQAGVVLSWATAWEVENKGFEVQRSTNAKSFERIGFLEGSYTTLAQTVYEFQDVTVLPGQLYYYRLRQNDLDGSSTLSAILAIRASVGPETELSIYPNPTNGQFTLSGQEPIPTDIKCYTQSGVEVPIHADVSKGRKTIDIRTGIFLAPGMYYLYVRYPDGRSGKVLKIVAR